MNSSQSYHLLLQQTAEKMKRYNLGLQAPCSKVDLERVVTRARDELGYLLPDGYVGFLSLANGLDWNGLTIFASERTPITGFPDRFIDGFIEANLAYRDYAPMKAYAVFGDDGVALFTYSITMAEYQVLTKVGLSVLKRFGTFTELLTRAMQEKI